MNYTSARVRGLAPWRPQAKTRRLLDQVEEVLVEYAEHLPLTLRQVLYRCVAEYGYAKDERAYDRLCEALNRARRAGLIPFHAIRDDGAVVEQPLGFHGLPDFWSYIAEIATGYRRERLDEQGLVLEIWVEAAGMVPQVARVARPFGITVFSSGGFDSLTVKYDAACRIARRPCPTTVLHVGDHDPSGLSIFDSAAEDVRAMLPNRWHANFRRVAVTPEQIEAYGLETAPPKATDRRGNWVGGTVQAEALAPDELAAEVERAIEEYVDQDVLDGVVATEEAERSEILRGLDEMRGVGER